MEDQTHVYMAAVLVQYVHYMRPLSVNATRTQTKRVMFVATTLR